MISRRTLLRGAGSTAVALPWLSAMGTASAATPHPRRVVWFYTPNGILRERWPTSMDLKHTVLEPLTPFASKLIVTRGLAMESGYLDPGKHDSSHYNGVHHMFTGERMAGERQNGAMSFDIFAGDRLHAARSRDGKAPLKFKHALLGILAQGDHISSSGPKLGVDPIARPHDAFKLMFSDLTLDNAPDPAADLRRLKRRSILDYLNGSTAQLCGRLGSEDRARVQQHLASIRELEQRIQEGFQVSSSCRVPAPPDNSTCPAGGQYDPICGSYKTPVRSQNWIAEQQMRLLAMAFACDLTRVGGLRFHGPATGGTLGFLKHLGWIDKAKGGKPLDQDHHKASHSTATPAQDAVLTLNHYYAAQLASFLAMLDSYPEGDGTVLDNTVVCWFSECGLEVSGHSRRNLGIVLAGGGGGHLRTGRYVNFGPPLNKQLVKGGDVAVEGGNFGTRGRPHNDLLVELINTVLPERDRVTTFGGKLLADEASAAGIQLNQGGLPELRG